MIPIPVVALMIARLFTAIQVFTHFGLLSGLVFLGTSFHVNRKGMN